MSNNKGFLFFSSSGFVKSLAFASLLLSGCSNLSKSTNSDIMSEIPGFYIQKLLLGQAYDTHTAKSLNLFCVTGTEIEVGNSIGELKYTQNATYDNIIDNLNGSLSVGVQFPAISTSVGAGYASENAATNLSETHTIYLSATPKSIKLLPDSLELSKSGKYHVEHSSDRLYEKCGDEFVSQIDLGATLMATLKFEFANIKDKNEFKGNLRVKVNAGLGNVNVEGDLDKLSDEARAHTSITLTATQFGGTPDQLFTILPSDLVICNLNNTAPCLEAFRNVINYGKTNFVAQLQDAKNFNIIKYLTSPYASSGYIAEQLVPLNPPAPVSDLVLSRRAEWQDGFERELLTYSRAEKILAHRKEALTFEQTKNIEKIRDYAKKNSDDYALGVRFCFDNPNNKCEQKVIKIQQYNAQELELDNK